MCVHSVRDGIQMQQGDAGGKDVLARAEAGKLLLGR